MIDYLFVARNWRGIGLRVVFWCVAICAAALTIDHLTFPVFFPELAARDDGSLKILTLAITVVVALPVLTLFFSMSMRMSKMNAQLAELAHRDSLTGLLNRKAFEDHVRARTEETNDDIVEEDALIVIDLDHFKDINDSHGHAAGDHVLRMVSVCIRGNVFERDRVARVGGEEFAAYLINSGAKGAVRCAERIRAALEESKAHFEGKTIRITASVGGTLYPIGANYETVYRAADDALYRAKNAGRNRCDFNGLPRDLSLACNAAESDGRYGDVELPRATAKRPATSR